MSYTEDCVTMRGVMSVTMGLTETLCERLSSLYPDAHCSLQFRDPFELLVATILSAQCTDARVNKVTPALFARYPTAGVMAKAELSTLEDLVRSTGFYRNKAKNLLAMSQELDRRFKGQPPHTMEELAALPGVGRKTANVVLGNAYQKPAGVVVDTHVKRLSFRLGLTRQTQPEKIEVDLSKLFPPEVWTILPHWLIQHGRQICTALKPRCRDCPLSDICPKHGLISKPRLQSPVGQKKARKSMMKNGSQKRPAARR